MNKHTPKGTVTISLEQYEHDQKHIRDLINKKKELEQEILNKEVNSIVLKRAKELYEVHQNLKETHFSIKEQLRKAEVDQRQTNEENLALTIKLNDTRRRFKIAIAVLIFMIVLLLAIIHHLKVTH
jgi:uncharacterized protein YjaZ